MPRLGELYPGICLTTEEKARKISVRVEKNLSQGLAEFLEWGVFQTKSCRENQNTRVIFSNFFSKIVRNVEKYFTAGQTTDGNMAHAHCVLDD